MLELSLGRCSVDRLDHYTKMWTVNTTKHYESLTCTQPQFVKQSIIFPCMGRLQTVLQSQKDDMLQPCNSKQFIHLSNSNNIACKNRIHRCFPINCHMVRLYVQTENGMYNFGLKVQENLQLHVQKNERSEIVVWEMLAINKQKAKFVQNKISGYNASHHTLSWTDS